MISSLKQRGLLWYSPQLTIDSRRVNIKMDTIVTFEAKKINVNHFRLLLWLEATYSMVFSIVSYGERWIFLCLLFTAILLLIAFCFFRLTISIMKRRAGEFSLNDEEQKIITKRKYVIPYNKVKTIKIFTFGSILRIDAFLSGFIGRKIPLLFTDIQDEKRIIPEIKNRFKDEKNKIYQKMIEINFFDYPDKFSISPLHGESIAGHSPCGGYYFRR